MAQAHGKDAYLNMDDTGGSPTDVSSYIDTMSGLPGAIEMADVTTVTLEDHAFIAGLDGVKQIRIGGPFDSTFDALVGTSTQRKTARTVVYGPNGNATPKWTGEAFISEYDIVAAATDAVRFTAVLTVTGAMTRS